MITLSAFSGALQYLVDHRCSTPRPMVRVIHPDWSYERFLRLSSGPLEISDTPNNTPWGPVADFSPLLSPRAVFTVYEEGKKNLKKPEQLVGKFGCHGPIVSELVNALRAEFDAKYEEKRK